MIDRILQDARKDAESIIAEARKSAEITIERQKELGRKEASEKVSSIINSAKNEVNPVREAVLTDARRRAGWMILSEKERLLEGVMDEVKVEFRAFTKTERYVPWLKKVIIEAGTVLGGGKTQVALNEHDSTLRLGLDTLSKEIEKRTGTRTDFELFKESINTLGGAIVRTVDGRVVVDNTFETILTHRERDLKPKIAKILFK
jgi:V/A-type H+-transporting ATPase subunit E